MAGMDALPTGPSPAPWESQEENGLIELAAAIMMPTQPAVSPMAHHQEGLTPQEDASVSISLRQSQQQPKQSIQTAQSGEAASPDITMGHLPPSPGKAIEPSPAPTLPLDSLPSPTPQPTATLHLTAEAEHDSAAQPQVASPILTPSPEQAAACARTDSPILRRLKELAEETPITGALAAVLLQLPDHCLYTLDGRMQIPRKQQASWQASNIQLDLRDAAYWALPPGVQRDEDHSEALLYRAVFKTLFGQLDGQVLPVTHFHVSGHPFEPFSDQLALVMIRTAGKLSTGAELTRLTHLSLTHTCITCTSLLAIAMSPSLRHTLKVLDVSHNPSLIWQDGLHLVYRDLLKNMQALECLDLSHTGICSTGVQTLVQELVTTTIWGVALGPPASTTNTDPHSEPVWSTVTYLSLRSLLEPDQMHSLHYLSLPGITEHQGQQLQAHCQDMFVFKAGALVRQSDDNSRCWPVPPTQPLTFTAPAPPADDTGREASSLMIAPGQQLSSVGAPAGSHVQRTTGTADMASSESIWQIYPGPMHARTNQRVRPRDSAQPTTSCHVPPDGPDVSMQLPGQQPLQLAPLWQAGQRPFRQGGVERQQGRGNASRNVQGAPACQYVPRSDPAPRRMVRTGGMRQLNMHDMARAAADVQLAWNHEFFSGDGPDEVDDDRQQDRAGAGQKGGRRSGHDGSSYRPASSRQHQQTLGPRGAALLRGSGGGGGVSSGQGWAAGEARAARGMDGAARAQAPRRQRATGGQRIDGGRSRLQQDWVRSEALPQGPVHVCGAADDLYIQDAGYGEVDEDEDEDHFIQDDNSVSWDSDQSLNSGIIANGLEVLVQHGIPVEKQLKAVREHGVASPVLRKQKHKKHKRHKQGRPDAEAQSTQQQQQQVEQGGNGHVMVISSDDSDDSGRDGKETRRHRKMNSKHKRDKKRTASERPVGEPHAAAPAPDQVPLDASEQVGLNDMAAAAAAATGLTSIAGRGKSSKTLAVMQELRQLQPWAGDKARAEAPPGQFFQVDYENMGRGKRRRGDPDDPLTWSPSAQPAHHRTHNTDSSSVTSSSSHGSGSDADFDVPLGPASSHLKSPQARGGASKVELGKARISTTTPDAARGSSGVLGTADMEVDEPERRKEHQAAGAGASAGGTGERQQQQQDDDSDDSIQRFARPAGRRRMVAVLLDGSEPQEVQSQAEVPAGAVQGAAVGGKVPADLQHVTAAGAAGAAAGVSGAAAGAGGGGDAAADSHIHRHGSPTNKQERQRLQQELELAQQVVEQAKARKKQVELRVSLIRSAGSAAAAGGGVIAAGLEPAAQQTGTSQQQQQQEPAQETAGKAQEAAEQAQEAAGQMPLQGVNAGPSNTGTTDGQPAGQQPSDTRPAAVTAHDAAHVAAELKAAKAELAAAQKHMRAVKELLLLMPFAWDGKGEGLNVEKIRPQHDGKRQVQKPTKLQEEQAAEERRRERKLRKDRQRRALEQKQKHPEVDQQVESALKTHPTDSRATTNPPNTASTGLQHSSLNGKTGGTVSRLVTDRSPLVAHTEPARQLVFTGTAPRRRQVVNPAVGSPARRRPVPGLWTQSSDDSQDEPSKVASRGVQGMVEDAGSDDDDIPVLQVVRKSKTPTPGPGSVTPGGSTAPVLAAGVGGSSGPQGQQVQGAASAAEHGVGSVSPALHPVASSPAVQGEAQTLDMESPAAVLAATQPMVDDQAQVAGAVDEQQHMVMDIDTQQQRMSQVESHGRQVGGSQTLDPPTDVSPAACAPSPALPTCSTQLLPCLTLAPPDSPQAAAPLQPTEVQPGTGVEQHVEAGCVVNAAMDVAVEVQGHATPGPRTSPAGACQEAAASVDTGGGTGTGTAVSTSPPVHTPATAPAPVHASTVSPTPAEAFSFDPSPAAALPAPLMLPVQGASNPAAPLLPGGAMSTPQEGSVPQAGLVQPGSSRGPSTSPRPSPLASLLQSAGGDASFLAGFPSSQAAADAVRNGNHHGGDVDGEGSDDHVLPDSQPEDDHEEELHELVLSMLTQQPPATTSAQPSVSPDQGRHPVAATDVHTPSPGPPSCTGTVCESSDMPSTVGGASGGHVTSTASLDEAPALHTPLGACAEGQQAAQQCRQEHGSTEHAVQSSDASRGSAEQQGHRDLGRPVGSLHRLLRNMHASGSQAWALEDEDEDVDVIPDSQPEPEDE